MKTKNEWKSIYKVLTMCQALSCQVYKCKNRDNPCPQNAYILIEKAAHKESRKALVCQVSDPQDSKLTCPFQKLMKELRGLRIPKREGEDSGFPAILVLSCMFLIGSMGHLIIFPSQFWHLSFSQWFTLGLEQDQDFNPQSFICSTDTDLLTFPAYNTAALQGYTG